MKGPLKLQNVTGGYEKLQEVTRSVTSCNLSEPHATSRNLIKILFLIDKLVPAGTQTNLLEIVRSFHSCNW